MMTNDPASSNRPRTPSRPKTSSFLSMLRRPFDLGAIVAATAALASGPLRRVRQRLDARRRSDDGSPRGDRARLESSIGDLQLAREAQDRVSERLARREADLACVEALFDQSIDAQVIYRIDQDGTPRIERCNAMAARLLVSSSPGDAPSGDARGQLLEDVFASGSVEWLKSDLTQALSTGGVVRRIVKERRPDGTGRVWDVVHMPLDGVAAGNARLVLGTSRETTHLRPPEGENSEANRLLRLAESVAHVGHWRFHDPEGDVFWSEEVFRICGIEPGTTPPTVAHSIEIFHPDDRTLVRSQLEGVRGNGIIDFAARLCRPDGDVRHVLVRGFRQFTDASGGCSMFGVIMDVTELRRAEGRLRDNAAMLKVTLDNMDQGLMMVDSDDRVSICNQRAQDLLDLPAALMASQPRFGEVLAYQTRHGEFDRLSEEFRRGLESNVPGGELYSYERTRPNGVVLDIRTAPLPAGGAVRTFTDVTTNRQAERALRATEARYRLLADNASDLIVLGQSDGHRSYISPAVKTLLGLTVEDAHGITLREWLHPDDLDHVFATTRALTPEEPGRSATFRLRHQNGSYIWAEAAFRRVEGEGGDFTIITAIRDVTERQFRTEELRMARDAAEVARSAAESASRAKTDFLATMSHEVRTPLNSIIGFSDLLASSEHLPPDLRRYADLVRLSGSALLTIVNDILDFSQVEAGSIALVEAPFDPAILVDNCLSIVRGDALSKALVIDARCDPDLPRSLVGDEGRLRQILLNLLANAIKFTREGSITLTLHRDGSGPGGETLRFAVTDTGIGIPRDKQHRLFQRFSQVDGSIRRDFGGTGLGLAICKTLVALMGGDIGVVSEHNQGATFWFTVALRQPQVPPPSLVSAPEPVPGRRGRLLLVEDVELNQELARLILERAGHSVDVVSDGAAAVAAVQDRPYDLVLMDLQMPGMDGMTATQTIRRLQPPVNRIPIVAMTANVLPDQLRLIKDAGMEGHVGKPINRDELFSTIARWLPADDDGRRTRPARLGLPALDRATFDQATYDKLIDLLGAETVARLAGKLNDELVTRFADLDEARRDVHRLMHDTHATMPAAGMLGLSALSAACHALQQQEPGSGGDGFAQAIAVLRARRTEAISILARLRTDGSGPTRPEGRRTMH